jgi:hypothetical protein
MAGVVEKITDPGSISMMEAVNGRVILGDVPKMRFVQA